jgi:hypothetical protein
VNPFRPFVRKVIRGTLPAILILGSSVAAANPEPDPVLDLSALQESHPRLLVSESDLQHLRDRSWTGLGRELREFLSFSGRAMLEQPPVTYTLTGRRLLGESRKALKRITTWALLYRLEGDPRFRDAAIREMEAAVAFPDWNPSHFLDVGEMALAVSIGTDWLWEELSPDQRRRFLSALREKAIQPSLDASHPDNWWIDYTNNWNPVCHSGLTAAALLLVESDPELAGRVIRRAIQAFPATLESYRPSGTYPEGPIYWDYGTAFSVVLLDLLDNAFGTVFQLDADPAFRASATFRASAVSPTGRFYNYADCGEETRLAEATAWFTSAYGDSVARYELERGLAGFFRSGEWRPDDHHHRMLPFVLLWYPRGDGRADPDLPRIWLGKGPNPVAMIREKWGDPDSLFLGFKGNDGSVSHAHMDAGSFVFEDKGVRWAIDLGTQNYNSLESVGLGMWDRRQHSDRWRIFRVGPYSHNLLLIDERPQSATAKADVIHLESAGDTIHGIVDLAPVYPGQADFYQRHFHLYDHAVLRVVDRIEGARVRTLRQGRDTATLHWRMLTRAKVSIDGDQAVLRQDGEELHLVVREPARFTLRSQPVDPPPYFWDEPNPGVTAIDIWMKADENGDQVVNVLMSTDPEALRKILTGP